MYFVFIFIYHHSLSLIFILDLYGDRKVNDILFLLQTCFTGIFENSAYNFSIFFNLDD